jgi:hypothetical protein
MEVGAQGAGRARRRSQVCFRQACVVQDTGLIPGGFAATTSGYEHLVDAVDREG